MKCECWNDDDDAPTTTPSPHAAADDTTTASIDRLGGKELFEMRRASSFGSLGMRAWRDWEGCIEFEAQQLPVQLSREQADTEGENRKKIDWGALKCKCLKALHFLNNSTACKTTSKRDQGSIHLKRMKTIFLKKILISSKKKQVFILIPEKLSQSLAIYDSIAASDLSLRVRKAFSRTVAKPEHLRVSGKDRNCLTAPTKKSKFYEKPKNSRKRTFLLKRSHAVMTNTSAPNSTPIL